MKTLNRTLIACVVAGLGWSTASAQQTCDGNGPKRDGNARVECDGSGPRQDGAGQGQRPGRRGRGWGRGAGQRGGQACQTLDMGPISEAEVKHVITMRQGEKLARDVYLKFHDRWAMDIFDRIAGSEQRHMDAIGRVIEAQDMTDPVSEDTPGTYEDPAFEAMYIDLTGAGQDTYVEALKTGAFIEELDIQDLQTCLKDTENEPLVRIFGNLMRGSRNHLRAFVSALAQEGQTYVPQLLTADQYDDIVNGPHERGQGRGQGMYGRRSRGRGGSRASGRS